MNKENKKVYSASVLYNTLDIPYKYLTHIMTKLAKSGILNSSKGREGGYVINKNPSEICLSDIIKAVDVDEIGGKCLLGGDTCNAKNPCSLHNKWEKPKEEIDKMLQNVTLDTL